MITAQALPARRMSWQAGLQAGMTGKQRLLIAALIVISFQLFEYVTFSVGPLSPTMLLELALAGVFSMEVVTYLRTGHYRQKLLVMLAAMMSAQVFALFRPAFALARFQLVFSSVLFYLLTVVAFSRSPRTLGWINRLHLILGTGTMFLFLFQNIRFTFGDALNLSARLGGNFPAAFMAILLPICWTRMRYERGFFRWLNVATMAGAVAMEVLSASRSGFLCLVAAVVSMALWLSSTRARMVLLVGAAAAVIAIASIGETAIVERVSSMQRPEMAVAGRLELQEAALLFITRHPWLGGDFRAQVFKYLGEVAPDSRISLAIADNVWDTQSGPHNGYLNVLAEHGIPVGMAFIGYFVWLFRELLRAARLAQRPEQRMMMRAACVSLAVFGIYMFFDHSYWALDYLLLVAIFECGLAHSVPAEARSAREPRLDQPARLRLRQAAYGRPRW
jgi:O-antigen ligase